MRCKYNHFLFVATRMRIFLVVQLEVVQLEVLSEEFNVSLRGMEQSN